MNQRTCTVTGCAKAARSNKADLCPMHYHRQYRHGDVSFNANEQQTGIKQARTYRNLYRPNHPLATKYGAVYEHRYVLYNRIGPGPHTCHWCGDEVIWAPKGTPNMLVVDHLNGVEHDNDPDNLVPSCAGCNSGRASQARAQALRNMGAWSGNDTIASLSKPSRRSIIDPDYRALDRPDPLN